MALYSYRIASRSGCGGRKEGRLNPDTVLCNTPCSIANGSAISTVPTWPSETSSLYSVVCLVFHHSIADGIALSNGAIFNSSAWAELGPEPRDAAVLDWALAFPTDFRMTKPAVWTGEKKYGAPSNDANPIQVTEK